MFQRKINVPETPTETPQATMQPLEQKPLETISQPMTPQTPLTPMSVASSSSEESNMERGMVLHQNEKGMSLVTVRSMSDAERNQLAHLEVARKFEAAEAIRNQESEIYIEKAMRDALAEQYHSEAKAEKKYEEELASIKYKEAQLKKKIENKLTEAMAEKTRREIAARQKFEQRKVRAQVLADEKIAAAKVQSSAIKHGAVVAADLTSRRKRINWRW